MKPKSLLDLPTELVTRIFEYLDEPSLLRCKPVSRSILTLIEQSISLKYSIELYAANLLDNSDSPLSKSARLRLLEEHQRAWTEGPWSYRTKIPLVIGAAGSPSPLRAWELTNSTFGVAGDHNIRFVQLPSLLRGIEKHEWGLEGFDFRIRDFATDRSQDLLVLLERETIMPCLSIRTECSSPSEFAYCKNAPFTTSWNDRIYVITITSIPPYPDLMLFIHFSSLLSLVCSPTPPAYIFSWEEWGPMYTRMVPRMISDTWFCYVHGLKVVIPHDMGSDIEVWDFHQPAVRRRSGIARTSDKKLETRNVADSVSYNDVSEDGINLFYKDVVTSLPYSISTFKNPYPTYTEYMISEDCLVVVLVGVSLRFRVSKA
ncbi:hypothetical protein DXG03_001569 [Asterophora parasitica]|uniref:F-box domain-containing protein n=1 Tax=Asterophora parasitica TaxID=117018 RepID=A0A9P7G9D0_9AGAR|nr:hypothetical protein DXG03_001569 [Asterophora parasitica]